MNWARLLGWFTGGGANGLVSQIRQSRKDVLDASNDKERLAADERTEGLLARLEAQTRGEASWLPKAVRAAWTVPFIIYTGKIILWDKVLGWGVTDPLGPYEQSLGWLIAGFYFLDATLQKVRG